MGEYNLGIGKDDEKLFTYIAQMKRVLSISYANGEVKKGRLNN